MMDIEIQWVLMIILLKNPNKQCTVMCELKGGMQQKGRVRRVEDTYMQKGLERNMGEQREGDRGMKEIKERKKGGKELRYESFLH